MPPTILRTPLLRGSDRLDHLAQVGCGRWKCASRSQLTPVRWASFSLAPHTKSARTRAPLLDRRRTRHFRPTSRTCPGWCRWYAAPVPALVEGRESLTKGASARLTRVQLRGRRAPLAPPPRRRCRRRSASSAAKLARRSSACASSADGARARRRRTARLLNDGEQRRTLLAATARGWRHGRRRRRTRSHPRRKASST